MPIILTCGQKNSGYRLVHKSLIDAGLVEARQSRQEHFSPVDITSAICDAYKIDRDNPDTIEQIKPGKVWQALSGDLMLANMNGRDWGWADPNNVYLLNYWRDYDPLLKFVLVYSSPEFAIAEMLNIEPASPQLIDRNISTWQAANAELLSFYNVNKDRAILVNNATISEERGYFIDLAQERLGVELADSPMDSSGSSDNTIPELIARLLVKDNADVQALCQELDSAADMPGGTQKELLSLAYIASNQYQDLQTLLKEEVLAREQAKAQLAEHKQLAEQRQIEIEELTKKRKKQKQKQKQKNDEYQSEISLLSVGSDEQKQENELLLLQLHQVQEELEQTFQKSQEVDNSLKTLREQKETTIREQQKLKTDNEHLKKKIAKLESASNAHSTNGAELSKLTSRDAELTKENELLLLQLHQVQEELEHYFLKYQEVTKSDDPAGEKPSPESDENAAAATGAKEATVDLRQFIDGDNWYYAEHDGRWAGPGTKSTIRLPAMNKGRYELILDIVDAIAPDILRDMKVNLNGKPLKFKGGNGQFGPWASVVRLFNKKLKYPVLLTGAVSIGKVEAGKDLQLEVIFPKTISPSSRGSDDMRDLAIRLRQVKLRAR